MIQVLYPSNQGWKEIFFDGEVKVVDNIAEFNHDHWRDILFSRGFEDYVEEDTSDSDEGSTDDYNSDKEPQKEETPKKTTRKRTNRKATSQSPKENVSASNAKSVASSKSAQ